MRLLDGVNGRGSALMRHGRSFLKPYVALLRLMTVLGMEVALMEVQDSATAFAFGIKLGQTDPSPWNFKTQDVKERGGYQWF